MSSQHLSLRVPSKVDFCYPQPILRPWSAVDAEYSQCFRSVKQHRVSLAIAGDSRKQAISESWLGSRWSQELLQQSAPSGSQQVVENRVLPIRSLHVLIVISFLIILNRQAGLAFAARY